MELGIRAGRVVTPEREINDAVVAVDEGVIRSVAPFGQGAHPQFDVFVDAPTEILVPGYIDLQVNGGLNCTFKKADAAQRRAIYQFFLRRGTTTLLPTIVGDSHDILISALSAVAEDVGGNKPALPEIAGLHLEGPFLNPDRRGAHPLEYLRMPDLDLARRLWEAARGRIAIVTLAPELEGGDPLVAWFVRNGAVVSAGHTAATCDVLLRACDGGLSLITHMGNASDWPYRRKNAAGIFTSEPGVVGTFMISDRLRASLIMDGYHFDPRLAAALVRLRGPQSIVLTSDASYATGCPPGQYDDGLIRTTVHADGYAYATDRGGWLAGSVITMEQAVQVAVQAGGISLREAVEMATLTPARVLGIEGRKGRIAEGCEADLVLLDEALGVRRVFRAGQLVQQSVAGC